MEKSVAAIVAKKTDPCDKFRKLKNLSKYLEDLVTGEGKIAEIFGTKVALYKHANKEGYMLIPECPHMGCLVRFNAAEKSWDCPCHGSRFRYDGRVINSPAFVNLEILSVVLSVNKKNKENFIG